MLLILYLEESAAYLHERKLKIQKFERQFHNIYDSDLKKEMAVTWKEIRQKRSEVVNQILLNLDEFRALHKYFPELLQVIMEDEDIGKVVSKKAWLLDFKSVPAQEAALKLDQLVEWRMQIKQARESLRGWVGKVNAHLFLSKYPIMRGFIKGDMIKADVLEAIKNSEKIIIREGWLLLLSDSLIKIPIAKFMTKINDYTYQEKEAKAQLAKVLGRGTVSETSALRKLEEITRKKNHYERLLIQILLANPGYLRSIKKNKTWLSREKSTGIEKFAAGITPHTLKEKAWLDEMRKLDE